MNATKRIQTERRLDEIIAKANLLRVQLAIAAEGVDEWEDSPLLYVEHVLTARHAVAAAMVEATTNIKGQG
jgi:hypothetical protein